MIEFHDAINTSLLKNTKITDNVEAAIIGITAMFCSFGTPQIYDMTKDNVLYKGTRARRKSYIVEEPSPSGSIESITPFDEFKNSLKPLDNFFKSPIENLNRFNSFLSKYSNDFGRSSVARYLTAETQFLNSLMEISERLKSIGKDNRQKTLIAELTIFNQSLPAQVCLPLWCRANSQSNNHHKVVRISSNDAVILNSAERVGFNWI